MEPVCLRICYSLFMTYYRTIRILSFLASFIFTYFLQNGGGRAFFRRIFSSLLVPVAMFFCPGSPVWVISQVICFFPSPIVCPLFFTCQTSVPRQKP